MSATHLLAPFICPHSRWLLGLQHPLTLDSQTGSAEAYHSRGFYSQAAELQEYVLEQRQKNEPDGVDIFETMYNLSLTYSSLGRIGDAVGLLHTVIPAPERLLGDYHPHTVDSTRRLAYLYRQQGRNEEVAELEDQVRKAQEEGRNRGTQYAEDFEESDDNKS